MMNPPQNMHSAKQKETFQFGMTGKTDRHQGESCKDRKYSNTIVSKTMDPSYNIYF